MRLQERDEESDIILRSVRMERRTFFPLFSGREQKIENSFFLAKYIVSKYRVYVYILSRPDDFYHKDKFLLVSATSHILAILNHCVSSFVPFEHFFKDLRRNVEQVQEVKHSVSAFYIDDKNRICNIAQKVCL